MSVDDFGLHAESGEYGEHVRFQSDRLRSFQRIIRERNCQECIKMSREGSCITGVVCCQQVCQMVVVSLADRIIVAGIVAVLYCCSCGLEVCDGMLKDENCHQSRGFPGGSVTSGHQIVVSCFRVQ